MTNLLYSAKHYQIKCAKSEENCKEYAEVLQNLLPNQENNAGKYLTTDGINPSWQEVNLTNKANNDLSNVTNVSQSFKNQSVNWSMPDYSAGVAISSGYEATESGWVKSNIYSDWGTSSANGRLLINDIVVSANYHSAGGAGKGHNNIFIVPISKGDVVTYTSNVSDVVFYPFKGAN